MSEQLLTVNSTHRGNHRQVIMEKDRRYTVKPQNPLKFKHRDRECILLNIIPRTEHDSVDRVAQVRFVDNQRVGHVDLGDLVPLDGLYEGEIVTG